MRRQDAMGYGLCALLIGAFITAAQFGTWFQRLADAWAYPDPVATAVSQLTDKDAVIFSPTPIDLIGIRAQYFDLITDNYIIYRQDKAEIDAMLKRLAALGIDIDRYSEQGEQCRGITGYLVFRCLGTYDSLRKRVANSDWRSHLSEMKTLTPKLTAAVISASDVRPDDKVLAVVEGRALLDLKGTP